MLSRTGSEDIAEVGLEFGLGAGFAVTQVVSMDLRGGLNTVITDETSRKFINATVGIYYRFLPWVK